MNKISEINVLFIEALQRPEATFCRYLHGTEVFALVGSDIFLIEFTHNHAYSVTYQTTRAIFLPGVLGFAFLEEVFRSAESSDAKVAAFRHTSLMALAERLAGSSSNESAD